MRRWFSSLFIRANRVAKLKIIHSWQLKEIWCFGISSCPVRNFLFFSVASTWYFCRNIHIFFDALHDSRKSVDSKLFQINKMPTRHVFGFDCRFVAAKKFKKSTFAILQNFSAKQSTFVTEIFQLCLWNCRRSHHSHHMMQQQKTKQKITIIYASTHTSSPNFKVQLRELLTITRQNDE